MGDHLCRLSEYFGPELETVYRRIELREGFSADCFPMHELHVSDGDRPFGKRKTLAFRLIDRHRGVVFLLIFYDCRPMRNDENPDRWCSFTENTSVQSGWDTSQNVNDQYRLFIIR